MVKQTFWGKCQFKTLEKFAFKMSEEIICEFCPESFHRQEDFLDHSKFEHFNQISENWEKCDYCDNFFPNLNELENHFGDCHSNTKQVQVSFFTLTAF